MITFKKNMGAIVVRFLECNPLNPLRMLLFSLSRLKINLERLETIANEAEGDRYIPQAISMVVYLRNKLEAV